jgi:hypothetical protein
MAKINALNVTGSASAAGPVKLATNAEALAAQSITLAITPAQLGVVTAGLKLLSFDGRSGAGAITLTGAAVGDYVIMVTGLTEGALGNASTSFEGAITVINQIQQSSASNLSANNYLALLIKRA